MRDGENEEECDYENEHFHHAFVLLSSAHRRRTVILVNAVVVESPYANRVAVGYDEQRNHPTQARPKHQVDFVALVRNSEVHSPRQRELDARGKDPGEDDSKHFRSHLDPLPSYKPRDRPSERG